MSASVLVNLKPINNKKKYKGNAYKELLQGWLYYNILIQEQKYTLFLSIWKISNLGWFLPKQKFLIISNSGQQILAKQLL